MLDVIEMLNKRGDPHSTRLKVVSSGSIYVKQFEFEDQTKMNEQEFLFFVIKKGPFPLSES